MRPFPSRRDHVPVSLATNKIEALLVPHMSGQTVRRVKIKMTQIQTLRRCRQKEGEAKPMCSASQRTKFTCPGLSVQDTKKETTANTPVLPANDHNEFRGPQASERQTDLRSCYEALVRDTEIIK